MPADGCIRNILAWFALAYSLMAASVAALFIKCFISCGLAVLRRFATAS